MSPSLPWLRTDDRLSLKPAILFLTLVPALIGVLLGATRAGIAAHLPWSVGIAFWVVASVGVWFALFAGTIVAALFLRPWSPPAWLVLIVGAIIGSIPGRYIIYSTAGSRSGWVVDGRAPVPAPDFELSARFLAYFFQGWAGVYLTWVVIGLGFDAWFFGERANERGSTLQPRAIAPPTPTRVGDSRDGPTRESRDVETFLARLPLHLGRDIVAIEAEDHYVRVHTALGSALILGRLSDAMDSLATLDGLRVHRSYWVRKGAIASAHAQGRGVLLVLSNGLRIPVSHGYKELARQSGVLATRSVAPL